MRCLAEVTRQSVQLRSHGATTDRRCQREAVVRGLCKQHSEMRECAYSACVAHATVKVEPWWLCRRHAKMYRVHNRIVERILEIPARA